MKYKKYIIILGISLFTAFTVGASTGKIITAELKPQKINYKGSTAQQEVITYNGVTYVPLRNFSRLIDMPIDYKNNIIYLGEDTNSNLLDTPTTSNASKKLEDLNYFCDMLETNHKNLYARISKEEFLKEKNNIANHIDTLSDTDFYYSLKSLLSLVGDAHTNIYYSDSNYKHLNALPFAVSKFEEDWRLMILDKANEKYLGDKLIAINDIPLLDVFEKAKNIISFENNTWAESQFSNTINFKEPLEYLDIVKKGEPIVLTIEVEDGSKQKVTLKPLSESEVMSAELVRYERKNLPQTLPNGIYRAMPLNEENLFIQYNSCQEDPKLPMSEFVKRIEEELSNKHYKNIILDLRYNSGGNSAIFEPMIEMIGNLKTTKGLDIYTLIGPNTFSSGIINAIQTKRYLESTLVGTPTGGSVNGYGELQFFELKNFPMTISYSTKYFELIKDYEKDSLYPDVEVLSSFEDYTSGVDTEIQWILKNR